jgi:hypothetical protein
MPAHCTAGMSGFGPADRAQVINKILILPGAEVPFNLIDSPELAPKLALDLGSRCQKGGESYTIPLVASPSGGSPTAVGPSGRRRTPAKGVRVKSRSRVRISLSAKSMFYRPMVLRKRFSRTESVRKLMTRPDSSHREAQTHSRDPIASAECARLTCDRRSGGSFKWPE